MKEITPLEGYVLLEDQEVNIAGISIAKEEGRKESSTGKVIKCGESYKEDDNRIECLVEEGDEVIYKRYTDQETMIENKTYRLVQFKDLIATIKDK